MLVFQRDQLVDCVERLALYAAGVVDLLRVHGSVHALGHALGARVAIGHRVAHERALLVEEDEIDAPGVDADGLGDLARVLAGAHAGQDALKQPLDVPAVVAVHALLRVVEAVYLLEHYLAVLEMPKHVAPGRGSDVYGQMVAGHLPSPPSAASMPTCTTHITFVPA